MKSEAESEARVEVGRTEVPSKVMQTKVECHVGPGDSGPSLCLACQRPFREGEVWLRYTSPPDPEWGVYIFGLHEECQ